MTTLGFRVRRVDRRTGLLAGGLALWATLVLGAWLDLVTLPGGLTTAAAVTFFVPPALVAAALLRGDTVPGLSLVAGLSLAVAGAITLPHVYGFFPAFAVGITGIVLAALGTHRLPGPTLAALFALVGFNGTLQAFTPLPVLQLVDILIIGLWFGLLGRLVLGRWPMPLRPTPAFALLAALFAITLGAMLVTHPFQQGLNAFLATWARMSVMLLIGYGAYSARTIQGASRVFAVVCLLVGAYATLRWAIGPAAAEADLNERDPERDAYNSITSSSEAKTQGSLFNGQQLAVWMSVAVPFLLALAISWRGRYRLVAIAGLPFSVVAMFASGQRTVVPAVIAGAATIMIIHMVSRSFRGPRLGVAVVAVVTLLATAAVVYPAVLDNPEKRQRYENILRPSEDRPFQERLIKWRQVLRDIRDQPFGFGVGAGDSQSGRRFADVSRNNIDNSYLMFAYDLGMWFAILYVIALLVLLVELIRQAIWSRGQWSAALATAAAGTLVSMMIQFMAANRVTSTPILAGWMVIGLGIATYGSRRESETPPA